MTGSKGRFFKSNFRVTARTFHFDMHAPKRSLGHGSELNFRTHVGVLAVKLWRFVSAIWNSSWNMYDFPPILLGLQCTFLEKVHCSSSMAEKTSSPTAAVLTWAKSTQKVEPTEGWFHAIEFCTFLGTNISRPKVYLIRWFSLFPFRTGGYESPWVQHVILHPTGKVDLKVSFTTSTHGGVAIFPSDGHPNWTRPRNTLNAPELTDIYQKNYTPVN